MERPLSVDEPTVSMTFQVNWTRRSAGQEGKFVTSRNISRSVWTRSAVINVALRFVERSDSAG